MLPDVLIVNIDRFRNPRSTRNGSKNCVNIEPSVILSINETIYSLNAVVTHYGANPRKGHYIATLHKNGHWIDCNYVVVKPANNDPRMGYLYFYDRVDNERLALPDISRNNVEEQSIHTQSTSIDATQESKKGMNINQSTDMRQITRFMSKKRKQSENSETFTEESCKKIKR